MRQDNIGALKGHSAWNRGRITLLLMTVPSFLFVLVFSYGPVFGYIYAFFDYRIGLRLSQCDFKGLYFIRLALSDPDLLKVLRNTLAISFLCLLNIPAACAFAIFLSEMGSRRYRKLIQTASTLPYFISWVIVYSITFSFFSPDSGFINRLLLDTKIITVSMNPLSNSDIAWFFQAGLFMWKNAGYNAIIFFAAINGIEPELYDAANVDGAGRTGRIIHVTLPGLTPTLVTLLLINIGFMLSNGFDQYYVFMNPLIQSRIEVLDYYVYRVGMQQNDISVSTALSMANTIVSIMLLFSANSLSKRLRGQSII